jgi:hypothetical protein
MADTHISDERLAEMLKALGVSDLYAGFPRKTSAYTAELRALITELQALRRTSHEGVREWRPIATAPKDGTRVDLWRQGHRVTDAFWDEGEEWWCIDSRYSDGEPCPLAVSPEPTHWQSLPAPPALSPNKEDEDAA